MRGNTLDFLKKVELIEGTEENRVGLERRQYSYTAHIPERRSGRDRRNSLEQKKTINRKRKKDRNRK